MGRCWKTTTILSSNLAPRHAINCMLSAYHMAEWIWGDWLQTDYATWKALGIRDRESFLAWVDKSQNQVFS